MKIILISITNFQEYIIDNIKNLLLFENNDIVVITEKEFFYKLKDYPVQLIDKNDLEDFNFNAISNLDKNFRNGFWHLCSLRFFYLYSYIKNNNIENCVHLENDVMTYINFDELLIHKLRKIYVTYDCETRVIPGIIFIPNYELFKPVIENYNTRLNDMENLANFDFEPFPIFPMELKNLSYIMNNINKYNKNFIIFNSIFDAAAIGQYLGGVDKRNIPGNTEGFINETCVIKYNNYKFYWIKENELYVPYIEINNKLLYKINNLHIHSKELYKFIANNPTENNFIKINC
jgi:hypothetical protein